MKRIVFIAGLLCAPVLGAAICTQAAPPFSNPFSKKEKEQPPAGVQWQSDLFAAHKLSMQQNKPMLVVFGAEWCGFCKKLEGQTLAHPQLAKYVNETFIPVHLDADKEQKVTEILGVESLPCSVVLSPQADLLGRVDGFFQAGPYYQKLVSARRAFDAAQAAAAQTQPEISQVKAE